MPHAAAPPSPPELSDDRASSRCLDEVGAATVLGAMVEQRRHSSSRTLAPSEPEANADDADAGADADAVATQRRPRLDPNSDLFQKIR
ncbi:MAG: hypothetical protein BGO98_45745 [Myxococcales bacterium 68-20]|nr:hypothetical protein [Myxococcales bacterium]OJY31180.1 MAG: hypothetical protein BGO98_45745 [Myxococcales bacterium 68-20]